MNRRFSSLVKEFLAWAAKCLRRSTVNVYRHYFKKWIAEQGDTQLSRIVPARLTAWAKTWHACQAIKRLFRWATVEACLIRRNPVADVKHPPKGYRRRIMSRKEIVTLLRDSKADLRRLLVCYRETFARPQELRIARWEDLASDNPELTLRQSLEQGRAVLQLFEFKDGRRRRDTETPRIILLSPRACRLLLRMLGSLPTKKGSIFLTSKNKPWTGNALRCRFRRLRKRLRIVRDKRGETIVPYTFRHTGATTAAAHGVRDRILADVLGHVETKTTARYCHLQVSHLRSAMQTVWSRRRPL